MLSILLTPVANKMMINTLPIFNQFAPLYPLKTSENLSSDVFGGYRSGAWVENGLNKWTLLKGSTITLDFLIYFFENSFEYRTTHCHGYVTLVTTITDRFLVTEYSDFLEFME